MPGKHGCIGGCISAIFKLVVLVVVGGYIFIVALHPWAFHIGGRSTPPLYWHGTGMVLAKDGKTYPFYVSFWPGRSNGGHGIGRREGKAVSSGIAGSGYLCTGPGQIERLQLSGTMFGGYLDTDNSLFDFRFLTWRKPFSINYQKQGFFDLAGTFQGGDLVMDRPNEQGIPFPTGVFINNATAKFHWADYAEFEAECSARK